MSANETLGEKIKRARKAAGLTQKQLGDIVGVTRPAVGQWESDITSPGLSTLEVIAKALGISAQELLYGSEYQVRETGYRYDDDNVRPGPSMVGLVPQISWVQAGSFTEVCFIDLDPDSTDWYPRPPNCGPHTFALRVVGESMLDKYPPGRIIFVDPDVIPLSGDDVVAVMTETGEATFKRYIEEPGAGRMLKALNPDWKDPYVSINGNCRVTGVVMAQMELRQR